jgi:hypothetical protein
VIRSATLQTSLAVHYEADMSALYQTIFLVFVSIAIFWIGLAFAFKVDGWKSWLGAVGSLAGALAFFAFFFWLLVWRRLIY